MRRSSSAFLTMFATVGALAFAGCATKEASTQRTGPALPLGDDVRPYAVVPARGDGALLFFTRGRSPVVRAAAVHGARVASDSYAVVAQELGSPVRFAPDPSSGGAIAAWTKGGAVEPTIMVRRIGPSGAPAGPARAVGAITAGEAAGSDVSPYLSALAGSADGHVLVGWSVTAMSSRPRLDGLVVDPSLQTPSEQHMLADDPGYGLALTPSPAGWLSAELLADQPDPTQPIPPQIDVGAIPAGRHPDARGAGWSGIENAGSLGPPALASTGREAMLAYAHGDRPAAVLAQPLTRSGDPIGQPIELAAVPAATAGTVRARVFTIPGGYRVAWSTAPDRRRSGAVTYVDVDPRGHRRGAPRTIGLQARERADLQAAHLLLRWLQTQDAHGRIGMRSTISVLP